MPMLPDTVSALRAAMVALMQPSLMPVNTCGMAFMKVIFMKRCSLVQPTARASSTFSFSRLVKPLRVLRVMMGVAWMMTT